MERQRILILGAAGRDFHNFNVAYRDRSDVHVVAFTATQIPNIADRLYPPELAGSLYPQGIPIRPENDLEAIVADEDVHQVVLAYSDLPHATVMHLGSRALKAGADFVLLGPRRTMLTSTRPVVAVTAVRTGCGKSQTSRYVAETLRACGRKPVVVRHPMPYGDLVAQRVQRFATPADLDAVGSGITIEEREEYEPHIAAGTVVFAGVDYGDILAAAEPEGDVVIWDGGNNDLPFYKPDLWITVADPHRPGHESGYHPGEANFRAASVIVINKADSATPENLEAVRTAAAELNPQALVVVAESQVSTDEPGAIRGRRVLVIEDGPTLTHGEMPYGAGQVAAIKYGAREVVDPHAHAVGSIRETLDRWTHIGSAIPAMGYYPDQIADLEATIRNTDCDTVVVATPIDLRHLLRIDRPAVRVRYDLVERGGTALADAVRAFAAANP